MTLIEAILFGLIQGLTEFIPVSSTAHIVILGYIFDIQTPDLTFEIFLHIASLLAVVLYFRRDLLWIIMGSLRVVARREQADDRTAFRFALYLGVATVLTGGLGIAMMKVMGDAIKAPVVVSAALFCTGILLILIERAVRLGDRDSTQLGFWDSVIVGLAQTIAVIPGVSRSGATLIAGLALGLNRDTAVRFSFLLAIPVLAGSSVLALRDIQLGSLADLGIGALTLSFVVSFFASLASIAWLIGFLRKQRLYWFSIYLFLLAAFVFLTFPSDRYF